MKIFIGSDHRGYDLKEKIIDILESMDADIIDVGTHDKEISVDYPKTAYKVATSVAKTKDARGILICMSGIGQSIAANKVKGAYAALCYNAQAAEFSRLHNNANILVLGAKYTKAKELLKILKVWLNAKFEGGRHQRRFEQIKKIESGRF